MFDIGGFELILIGIVALLVMGDDFPSMFRTLGQFTGKMRKMAREFSRAMEEAADDAGVKDVASTLKTAANPKSMGLEALNRATENLDKWEAGTKNRIKPEDTDAVASDKGADATDKTVENRAKAEASMSEKASEAGDAAAELEPEPEPDAVPQADEAKT